MSISGPQRQRGLSLIELIMFMVIMGVAAAAILQVMNMATKTSADPIRRKQALLIAEAYMEEVELAHFTFCDPSDVNAGTALSAALGSVADPTKCATTVENLGPEVAAGNSRPYDNVNDYAVAGQAGQPQPLFTDGAGHLTDAAATQLGLPLTALSGFTATVALNVVPVAAPLGPAGIGISSNLLPTKMDVLRITITVSDSLSANANVTLDGYRTRYAPRTSDP